MTREHVAVELYRQLLLKIEIAIELAISLPLSRLSKLLFGCEARAPHGHICMHDRTQNLSYQTMDIEVYFLRKVRATKASNPGMELR